MLEALDLNSKLSKADYKARMPALQTRLHQLQRACWEAKLATVVVFEGWDAAGKGTAINKLTQRLEPRGFSLHAIREPRTFETHMPWMWRFWNKIPNWGEVAIFDRSWYGRVLVERVEGLIEQKRWSQAYNDIVSFERALADDRYVVVKFFLHIDKKEQKERFKKLESDSSTAWHVEPEDWEHHKKYDEYLVATEEMLERTESEWGPWTLVEATDRRWSRIKVFDTLIGRMEEGMRKHGQEVPEPYVEKEEVDDIADIDDEEMED
jgi:polyphosphate kinase 2 (PPK2 family)